MNMTSLNSTIKQFSLATLLLLGSFVVFTQSTKASGPPPVIESSFNQKFPNAKSVKWEKSIEGQKFTRVEFKNDNKKQKAIFDKNGNIMEVQTELKTKELPAKVLASLSNIYPSERILNVMQIDREGRKPVYQVVLKLDSEKTQLTINNEGLFCSR